MLHHYGPRSAACSSGTRRQGRAFGQKNVFVMPDYENCPLYLRLLRISFSTIVNVAKGNWLSVSALPPKVGY
ncbi:hypothetical protein HOE425_331596 [Hoeflea sp. EC-HK425]|nr:hypothetical protein HOE425_331596 [Hoeflea sp. EC-HK425]